MEDLQSLHTISWWYDWGPNGNQPASDYSLQHDIEFVPMQWGKWGIEDLAKDINPNARHLLGMNEPGHQQQANLSPVEASTLWPVMEQVAKDRNLKLGTPSPAPCGAQCVRSSPFQWSASLAASCLCMPVVCNAIALGSCLDDCKVGSYAVSNVDLF